MYWDKPLKFVKEITDEMKKQSSKLDKNRCNKIKIINVPY